MSGLRNLCRAYGAMTIQGVRWVWDYVADEPVKESDMPVGSERWRASETAKWRGRFDEWESRLGKHLEAINESDQRERRVMTTIFGTHDENTLRQLEEVSVNAERVALMADGHLGYCMPIGGVAAYRNRASVGVGFDIACGNCAIRTDLTMDRLVSASDLGVLADAIHRNISFGVGRKNKSDDAPVDHPLFNDSACDALPENVREPLRDKARRSRTRHVAHRCGGKDESAGRRSGTAGTTGNAHSAATAAASTRRRTDPHLNAPCAGTSLSCAAR